MAGRARTRAQLRAARCGPALGRIGAIPLDRLSGKRAHMFEEIPAVDSGFLAQVLGSPLVVLAKVQHGEVALRI